MAAGSDSQKQLLTLIRDFATEKSQGERRVVGLKKQLEELRSELDTENEELEQAKRCNETIEQEIKGYEVELSMNDTSIQTLEARISLIQDEISTVGYDLEALKNEEGALRDDFISRMFEFNTIIRKFQERMASSPQKEEWVDTSPGHKLVDEEDAEADSRNLKDELANLVAQTTKMEQEFAAEQSIHEQAQLELIGLDRKVSLMAATMNETKELLELTRQSSELEEKCTSLGEELQRRSLCPSCHLNNVEAIGGILQGYEEN